MTQTNEQIDIRELCMKVLKNWHWFVLSCFICGCLGILYYVSANKKYRVDATIMLRDENNKSPLPISNEMLSLVGMGSSKHVDEKDKEDLISSAKRKNRINLRNKRYQTF